MSSRELRLSLSVFWGNGVDITGTATLVYCDIGTGTTNGANCLSASPLFVDGEYFHLKSKRGNYINGYFSGGSWAFSTMYSPALDAGDPNSAYRLEPKPSGNRINIGAYGNTEVASFTSSSVGTCFVLR